VQQQVVLDGDAGDEAVYGGADRHPSPAAAEVDESGFFLALDGILGTVESIGAQILREKVELRAGSHALQHFLKDLDGYPERMSALFDLHEAKRGVFFPIVHVHDSHRSVDRIQGQRPSRSAL
jgi:hypothetical protein